MSGGANKKGGHTGGRSKQKYGAQNDIPFLIGALAAQAFCTKPPNIPRIKVSLPFTGIDFLSAGL